MAGRANISGADPRALRVSVGRPAFRRSAATIAPANIQGPLVENLDVTDRFKSLISGNTARPVASMFPIWDRLRVVQGSPSAEDVHFGVTPGFQDRVTSVLTYDADLDSLDVSPRKMFPKDIVGMTVYSGNVMDLSGDESERRFASRVMYEATKAGVIMRLLDVNRRFGPHFSYADIDRLQSTDGYFSWFAVLKAFDEQESFLYDRTNLALGAIRALSGGFVTISQINEENGRDRDTVIKTILSKFPFLRGEFKGVCSVFYTLYVAKSQSKAVLGVRESVVRALKYLAAAEPRMYGVPFDKLDEMTQAHATVAIEETGHFLAYLRRSFPQMTNWFLVSPLGQAEELPHPLAGEDLFKGFVRMPERRYLAQGQDNHIPGRCDGTDIVRSIIEEKMPGFACLMPETALMTIMQGGPNPQETGAAIKDIVSGRQYFLFEYEYASATPASNPNKRYPTGIKHCTLFSGDDNSLSSGKIGDFADIAAFKVIQLRILGRLLEANKHGDYFSENDLKTILRSDAYIHMMSVVAFLKDIDQYKFDTSIIAGIVLTFFLAGNNNFGSGTKGARSAEQIGTILRKVPELAQEYTACQDAFRAFYVHNDANDPKDIERKHNIAYATVRCLELNDEVNEANEDEEMCEPDKRDFSMLYSAALDFIPVLKAACQDRDNWLINAPVMQFPAILPEVATRTQEVAVEAVVEPQLELSGDSLLRLLKSGFEQSGDADLAALSCAALEDLSAFGGREKYWLLPEVAHLEVTLPEGSLAGKRSRMSALEIARFEDELDSLEDVRRDESSTHTVDLSEEELLEKELREIEAQEVIEAKREAKRAEKWIEWAKENLPKIKYAAREALSTEGEFSRMIASNLDDPRNMEAAAYGIMSGNDLWAYKSAKVMLSTQHIRRTLKLRENDPEAAFKAIRAALTQSIITISANLKKRTRQVGLAAALLDLTADVLNGKIMSVAFDGTKDEKGYPNVIERRYDRAILDSVSVVAMAASLSAELSAIGGRVTGSSVRAFLAAEKMLDLEALTGFFSSRKADMAALRQSFGTARRILTERIQTPDEDVVAAASALARLKDRDEYSDDVLFGILFHSEGSPEDLGYRIEGLSALASDRSSGVYEKMLPFIGKGDDIEKAVLSAYVLTAGINSLLPLSNFDINSAPAQKIAAMLAEARIPTPERMAKLIVANRPYAEAGLRGKKVNGLGNSKEDIANVFDRANASASVKDVIFRALCSDDPVLTAMAVTASTYLREKKSS